LSTLNPFAVSRQFGHLQQMARQQVAEHFVERVTDLEGDIETIADTVTLGGFPHLVRRRHDDLYLLVPDDSDLDGLLARLGDALDRAGAGAAAPVGCDAGCRL
jgi:hypothetical protein